MCETLVGFITRVPDNLQGMKTEPKNSVSQVDLEGREELDLDSGYDRPEVEHDNEKEVQRSYATVKLLVNQYPSPQLQRFLDAKVSGWKILSIGM